MPARPPESAATASSASSPTVNATTVAVEAARRAAEQRVQRRLQRERAADHDRERHRDAAVHQPGSAAGRSRAGVSGASTAAIATAVPNSAHRLASNEPVRSRSAPAPSGPSAAIG